MPEKKNRIIVDVDNTLWDFASVLYRKISHYGVPEPSEWYGDFYKRYFSLEQLMWMRFIMSRMKDTHLFLMPLIFYLL